MYQTKLFSGCFCGFGGQAKTADDEFNEWIKDHQGIEIIKFTYRHARHGDHSIAILYKEDTKKEVI